MSNLYPLKFRPRFVQKMWGGRRLETVLGKKLPPDEAIGESWELFDFPPGVVDNSADWVSAEVAEGPSAGRTLHDLMTGDRESLLGSAAPVDTPHGPQFPLLIKFLDAEQDLSVQVHPDEAYAASHDGAHLKNEAWYVLAHDEGARLLKGLEADATRQAFEQAIADGTVEDLLTSLPAKKGEVHYLPSGTVHALGAGMLVAEVQTPSDTTYRVHDFKRVDPKSGQERELHVDQAMECIDFSTAGTNPTPPRSGEGVVAEAPQFTMTKRSTSAGHGQRLPAGPVVLMILDGTATLIGDGFEPVHVQKGDTLLLPAVLTSVGLLAEGPCEWLEASLPA